MKLEKKELEPPYKPPVRSAVDTGLIDKTFTREPAIDSLVIPKAEDSLEYDQDAFDDYHFNAYTPQKKQIEKKRSNEYLG